MKYAAQNVLGSDPLIVVCFSHLCGVSFGNSSFLPQSKHKYEVNWSQGASEGVS